MAFNLTKENVTNVTMAKFKKAPHLESKQIFLISQSEYVKPSQLLDCLLFNNCECLWAKHSSQKRTMGNSYLTSLLLNAWFSSGSSSCTLFVQRANTFIGLKCKIAIRIMHFIAKQAFKRNFLIFWKGHQFQCSSSVFLFASLYVVAVLMVKHIFFKGDCYLFNRCQIN